MRIKCKICNKAFNKNDDIVITDGKYKEAVHDECHYDYLANQHMNYLVTLDELKQELKNLENF